MNNKLSEDISFGKWLRQRRRMLDLTQKDLADQVGCARITLRQIEADALKPSKELALILLEKLGIPESDRSKWLLFARGNWQAALIREDKDALWLVAQIHEKETVSRRGQLSTPKIHEATFLFTDIEDSAKLWEAAPEKMKVALQRHHGILQETITANGGTVFQIVGDAFCAAFLSAPAAISAAVTVQRKLYRESWDLPFPIRVRMGIHTGEAESTSSQSPTGGYASNQTLNRVARILQAGHGGQVLLSLATKELTKDSLPINIKLRDMGEHYLRNLIRPEHLFQLNIPDLPSDFPPLNTLGPERHNLPVQLTSFIGREIEIAEVTHMLADAHMVTLIGAGGTGKTRLSIQVAQQVLENYPDGVWLVELAPILDPSFVLHITAITLGLRDKSQRPVLDMLCEYLHRKKMLIILDNCEHLVDTCARMTEKILRAAPNVRILATSREPLDVTGEKIYRVPSLDLPDLEHLPPVAVLSQYEAIQLFIERAAYAVPAFHVASENAAALAQICHHLDGIPLAIELAAAKVSILSLEQINKRLDDRFRLLTDGSRTALPQHQTLQATMDWSYDLLSFAERSLFQRLAVFVNGWSLEAAEFICSDTKIKSEDVLELLSQLINKSLVNKEELTNETRYSMLETIREYALKKLDDSGEMDIIYFRHLMFFAKLVEEAESNFKGPDQALWYNRLDREIDNLRVALTRFKGLENVEIRLRFAAGLWRYWKSRRHSTEGREHLKRILEDLPPGSARQTPAYARALTAVGSLAYYEGDFSYSEQTRKEALAIFRNLDDKVGIADCLNGLGNAAISQGNYESAGRCYEESLMIRKDLGDKWGVARLLGNLGLLAYFQTDYVRARSLHFESLSLFRELRDEEGIANELGNLGDVVRHQGELLTALTLYEESATISRKLKDQWGLGYARMGMADVALAQGDLSKASSLYRECLIILQKGADFIGLPFALESVATLALRRNQPEKAVRLLSAADVLRKNTNSPLPLPDHSSYQNNLSSVKEQLDPSMFDFLWSEGRAMTIDQAIAVALEELAEDKM